MKRYDLPTRFLLIIIFSACSNLEDMSLNMFRRDLYHCGFYDSPAVTSKPVMDWKYKTGIDTVMYNQAGIQGSPVISVSTA